MQSKNNVEKKRITPKERLYNNPSIEGKRTNVENPTKPTQNRSNKIKDLLNEGRKNMDE
jgi:hypothetical protein